MCLFAFPHVSCHHPVVQGERVSRELAECGVGDKVTSAATGDVNSSSQSFASHPHHNARESHKPMLTLRNRGISVHILAYADKRNIAPK